MCDRDIRLPREPEIVFKCRFTNWIKYLSIDRIYYDLKTCINRVNEYMLINPSIKSHYLDLSTACKELCALDHNFPPNGLWVEYYGVNDLRDLIRIMIRKKRTGVIL